MDAVAEPSNDVDVAGTVTRAGAGRRGEGPLTLQLPTAHQQHGARGKLPRSRDVIYVCVRMDVHEAGLFFILRKIIATFLCKT